MQKIKFFKQFLSRKLLFLDFFVMDKFEKSNAFLIVFAKLGLTQKLRLL
jgi:hypothetical protein